MGYGALTQELIARVRDWRRYAPVAGSAVAHALVLLAVGAMMAVAPPRQSPPPKQPPIVAVTLVREEASAPPVPRRPQANAAPKSRDAPPPPVPARRRDDRNPATPKPAAPSASASNDAAVETLPSSPGVPLGLQRLLESDPCRELEDRLKRGDCDTLWAKLAEEGRQGYSPTLDRLAAMYPEYRPDDPDIPFWVPIALAVLHLKPEVIGIKPQYAGGQVMRAGGMMPSGAASAGGPSDMVGRLAKPIPDPVFDVDVPQWLDFDHPARLPRAVRRQSPER